MSEYLSEDDRTEEREDGAPIEVLEAYFEARGWTCERAGDGEIVASAPGSWAQYELRGVWRPDDQVLQFLAFPDIKVAAEKRPAIYETLGLINEQLWLGHFELWSGSGLIVFRYSALLDTGDGDALSFEQAEAIAEAALEECERFFPVFQFVLWGGKSPGEAISAALIDTAGEA
ncbi:YbjN domain-containing protein [Sphingomonas sp. KRR8]|uniref:YbjN domain-containing protein n=1 Tax=Sphingomonas sp. KRR8 TaxID=2942996 RepID=UPI0020215821|nr:YbjN domain-containing protein [Sphingomonas sp. KRR8]URD61749.1 YbjN domain-containing protein [Sphingomonas sp. KRR8]